MVATTTASLNSILKKIKADYPQFTFKAGSISHWAPSIKTIYYPSLIDDSQLYTLFHELGHAISNHADFDQDIVLLRMEREAWETASKIAEDYGYHIKVPTIENSVDSYRDWLYARSRCPTCNNAGIQKKGTQVYACPLCTTTWRVNDARQCGLKRYTK